MPGGAGDLGQLVALGGSVLFAGEDVGGRPMMAISSGYAVRGYVGQEGAFGPVGGLGGFAGDGQNQVRSATRASSRLQWASTSLRRCSRSSRLRMRWQAIPTLKSA